ncbi:protein RIC-3b [Chanos chanos]|uniref:Protein RIC-3b n=1 Tax=Chanos chanos TaxID=29144 RepID=A0A6J2WAH8_CHACN|nr:protein RIC-3-like [Chanos chanos]
MSMSTFQKITLVSCLVLCVALLLPKMLLSRGKRDVAQPDGTPGHYPPMVHRQPAGENRRGAGKHFSRAHNPEAIARAKSGGTGAVAGGKSNLAGQIIPVYGFGILLYILYILFKITSKGKSAKPSESRLSALRSENMKRKITDFELAQLQEKLKETEEVMERIVSKSNYSPERIRGVSADQEEKLLLQLREITCMMKEGRLVEEISPETAEDSAFAHDWEDYPEEPHQEWDHRCCRHGHFHQPSEETETVDGGVELEDGGELSYETGGDAGVPDDVGPGIDVEDKVSDDAVSGADQVDFEGKREGRLEDEAVYEEQAQGFKHQDFPEDMQEDKYNLNWTDSCSSVLRRRNKNESEMTMN